MKVMNLFGIHEQALALHARRHKVLASNIANADTPHYKARDVSFTEVLRQAHAGRPAMMRTHPAHLAAAHSHDGEELLYRVPTQPSLDGNTVEADVEQAAFADNAVRYQASLMFVSGRIRSLRSAITGE